MAAQYPANLYTPRTMANRPGVSYDALKTKVIYAEDFNKDRDEIVAIETELGTNPKGSYASVAAFLADLADNVSDLWTALSGKEDALGFTPENVANKKTSLSDNSDTYYPSQKAVKTEIDYIKNLLFCNKFFLRSTFESIDMWLKSGTVALDQANCMRIQTAASTNAEAYAEIYEQDNHSGQAAYTQNPEFQANLFFDDTTSQVCYIGPVDDGMGGGFGFKVVNSTLYAFYIDNDGVEQTHSLGSISSGTTYILKCKYDNTAHYFYWYVNGTQEHSQAYTLTMATPAYAFFYIKTTTTSLRRMYVADFYYLADLLMI